VASAILAILILDRVARNALPARILADAAGAHLGAVAGVGAYPVVQRFRGSQQRDCVPLREYVAFFFPFWLLLFLVLRLGLLSQAALQ
jgi:hypothetical protein